MNLLEFKEELDFEEQFSAEFFLTKTAIRCYFCKGNSPRLSDYKLYGNPLSVHSSDEELEKINVRSFAKVGRNQYVIATGIMYESYHCKFCTMEYEEITESFTNMINQYIEEALSIVNEELGLNVVAETYTGYALSEDTHKLGYFDRRKPNTVHINLAILKRREWNATLKKTVYGTVAHEARHAWQWKNGSDLSNELSYLERPHEKDAFSFQYGFIKRHFAKEPILAC